MSINRITKEEYPEIWSALIDDLDHDATEKEHRRGSTFYMTPRYTIYDWGNASIPSDLYGMWEGDTCTWSDEWGMDTTPDVLYRVEEKEEVVVTKSWVRVKSQEDALRYDLMPPEQQ